MVSIFRVSNFETSAVQDLREKILGSRSQLVAEFQRFDKTFVGLYFKFVQYYSETFTLALVLSTFMPRHLGHSVLPMSIHLHLVSANYLTNMKQARP